MKLQCHPFVIQDNKNTINKKKLEKINARKRVFFFLIFFLLEFFFLLFWT